MQECQTLTLRITGGANGSGGEVESRQKERARGQMFAVAVRDGETLFLLARVRRAPKGDVYILHAHDKLPTPPSWPDWDPHTSYHVSGELHQRWFGDKFMVRRRGKPDHSFRGTENLITLSLGPNVPRARGVICKPDEFSQVLEIPVSELRTGPKATHIAIDLCEPGGSLMLRPRARVLRQGVFQDAAPWIVVTVYEEARVSNADQAERTPAP